MNLDKAKELFSEIVDSCYMIENQRLIEIIEPINREIDRARDISEIIILAQEFQVSLNEMDFMDDEEDEIQDMHEKIEKLSE